VNGVLVSGHDHGAGLVIAADGPVELRILRGPVDDPKADAPGSGETLQTLGVDLSALLPQRTIDIDMDEVMLPAILTDDLGANAHAIKCKFCACSILPVGKVTYRAEMRFAMPPMPRGVSQAGTISGAPAEDMIGFWRAGDKFDFENVTVTKVAGEGGFRFLSCAECELGPFGWFTDEKVGDQLGEDVDFFVAADRVRYT
jgi:hypothetical protein